MDKSKKILNREGSKYFLIANNNGDFPRDEKQLVQMFNKSCIAAVKMLSGKKSSFVGNNGDCSTDDDVSNFQKIICSYNPHKAY